MKVGKLDCTSEGGKDICERFGVDSYPTLFFFPVVGNQKEVKDDNIVYFEYEGENTPKGWDDYTEQGGFLKQKAKHVP
jgi:hypothetical protein